MLAYLPLILKNCWRNRRRTTLTIASIGVSMCLLGVMISLYHSFYLKDPAPNEALRLITRNRISLTVTIPASYRSRILQVPGVREAMAYNWFGGTYKDARDPKNFFARFAIEPDKMFNIFAEYKIPDDQKSRLPARPHRLRHRPRPREKVQFPGRRSYQPRGRHLSRQLRVHRARHLRQPPVQRGHVHQFGVHRADPPRAAPRQRRHIRHSDRRSLALFDHRRNIDAGFRNSPFETKTESEHAFTVGFLSLLGNVKMFLMWISAAVLFTILLVSANTMAMSVRERVREIGVFKTLGFTPGRGAQPDPRRGLRHLARRRPSRLSRFPRS